MSIEINKKIIKQISAVFLQYRTIIGEGRSSAYLLRNISRNPIL
jgi:hypothetical protein